MLPICLSGSRGAGGKSSRPRASMKQRPQDFPAQHGAGWRRALLREGGYVSLFYC